MSRPSPAGQLIALGTGGWISTPHRQTSCYLYRAAGRALILDAGSGFGRLTLDPGLLDGITELTIVLSHFHLDHIEGLAMVNNLDIPVTIGGPGRQIYGVSTRKLLGRLLDQPFKTSNPFADADVVELSEGDLVVNAWPLTCRQQFRHPLPSMGFRVGDDFAYLTDTEFDEKSSDFVGGVSWLLHEAWGTVSAERGHASGVDAGRVALEAGVRGLYLTHANPAIDQNAVLAAAQSVFTSTFLPADGQELFNTGACCSTQT